MPTFVFFPFFLIAFMPFMTSCSDPSSSDLRTSEDLDFKFGNERPIDPLLVGWFERNGFYQFSKSRSSFLNSGLKWISAMRAEYGSSIAVLSDNELALLHAISSVDGHRMILNSMREDLGSWQPAAQRFDEYRKQAEESLQELIFERGPLSQKLRDLSGFEGVSRVYAGHVMPPWAINSMLNTGGTDEIYRTPMPLLIEKNIRMGRPVYSNQVIIKIPLFFKHMENMLEQAGIVNLAPFSMYPESPQVMLFSGWDYAIRHSSVGVESYRSGPGAKAYQLYSFDVTMMSFAGDKVAYPCKRRRLE